DSPGEIPPGVVRDFFSLIGRIAAQGDRQEILEHFKSYFANAVGYTESWSSNVSWAETDLDRDMWNAAKNAPLFIEAFHDACETLAQDHPIVVPDVPWINRILSKNEASYEIQPPNLISRNPQESIVVAERTASLDEQAQEIIQTALKTSEQF